MYRLDALFNRREVMGDYLFSVTTSFNIFIAQTLIFECKEVLYSTAEISHREVFVLMIDLTRNDNRKDTVLRKALL